MFTDRALSLGIDFEHRSGASGQFLFPEIAGAGVALFDLDNDGDLDAYLVQSGSLVSGQRSMADRLYRNDLKSLGKFVDITESSGLNSYGYGMGVAIGDVNGDGFLDLFVSNFGPNVLYINGGDGRFAPAPERQFLADQWSASASFADVDRDGDLDLYVVNYVDFDARSNPRCFAQSSRRDYCGPGTFKPSRDVFYLNQDGVLIESTQRFFPAMAPAPGLGVVAADFNGDGFVDFYVANDGAANQLWLNQGGAHFRDQGLLAGVAVNGSGLPEASMGIAAADYDHDGDIDLFLSHLMGETNTLYRNEGRYFVDVTARVGLAAQSLRHTGWGTAFVDLNGDNLLDLLILNGAVRLIESQRAAGRDYPFAESNQAFVQDNGRFIDVSTELGDDFASLRSSRGAAFGDIDNDGDVDILVNNSNARPHLYIAESDSTSSKLWLGLVLKPAHRGIGAMVQAKIAGNIIFRRVHRDGSYASSSDPRLILTVPADTPWVAIKVLWADGVRSEHQIKPGNKYETIAYPN